jgi:serine/threonine-protein kinase
MTSEAATRAEGPDPLIGKVLDERYRIEVALGQGGIGRVYKARHLILGRHVALKVLLAQYESIPVLKERFRREAEALAALSHPNIVTVTDFGVADGMPYLVMELLEGEDLAALLYREMLEPKRAFNILRQVLLALSYAHSRDLVHRDLKPHNVFVRSLGGGTDHVEVLDFGLARFMGDSANRGPKLTKVGALIGTPAYMAPEQASGEAVDARADVYSAGLVLFEALSGRKPFESNDPGEILRAHLLQAPPRLGQADTGLQVSDQLEALLAKALAKSPADRFQTADEMLKAIDALPPDAALRLGPRPPRDQPIRSVAPTQGGVAETRAATPDVLRVRSSGGSPSQGSAPSASLGGPAPASSIALPKNKFPMMVGIGCAGGVLVGAVLTLFVWLSNGTEEPAPAPSPTAEQPTATQPAPAPSPSPAPAPTQSAPVPSSMCEVFGQPITEGDRELWSACQELDDWDRHPSPEAAQSSRDTMRLRASYRRTSDPRYLFLAAHIDMTGRRLSMALPDYQRLVTQHADEARRDTRTRTNLVQIACSDSAARRRDATELLRSGYGASAAPAVAELLALRDAQLVAFCRNGDARAHLERLRTALESPSE